MQPQDPAPGNSYRIQSKATGFWLAVAGRGEPGFDEGVPHIVAANEARASIWEVEAADIGYRFKNRGPVPWGDEHAGGDVEHSARLDSNAERQVYAFKPNDGAYQKWRLSHDGEGYRQLVNVATGLALDGNADEDIYTMQPNDGAYQRWGFFPA